MDTEEITAAEAKAAELTQRIVDRFGGIRPMAAKLEIPATTVQGWKKRGIIPQTRHGGIMTAAVRNGIAIDPLDLAETDPGGAAGRAELRAAEGIATAPAGRMSIRRRGGLGPIALIVACFALLAVVLGAAVAWTSYLQPLELRVAALETAPAGPDLESRVAKLEARRLVAGPAISGDVDDRVTALEQDLGQIKTGAANVQQLAKQLSDLQLAAGGRELLAQSIRDIQSTTAATQGEVERLGNELAALGARVDRIDAALAERKRQGLRSDAVLLAVGQLRAALRDSKPFAKEAGSVRALVGDDAEMTAVLDKIQPYADDGAPTLDELRGDFAKLAPQIVRSAVVGDGSSWWRQALYRMGSLISIRRVGDSVPGDTAEAIVARAEAKLDSDDLSGSVATLRPLTGLPAAVAAPWAHDAERRLAVDGAESDLSRLAIERVAAGNADAPAAAPAQ
jgi:hypothetical protein